MLRFVLRRALETAVLLALLSILIFALFELIPGDYLSEMELNPAISRETIQRLRREYGIDRPFHTEYFSWLSQLLQGNFGYSFAQQRPAVDLIGERLTNTLVLTVGAFSLTLLISFPMGTLAALRAGQWPDKIVLLFSVVAFSFPTLLLSLVFLYVAFVSGWFPIGGLGGAQHLLLPSLTLALPSAAFLLRVLRAELIVALDEPFIVAAMAKGLPPARVLFHALRKALNPVLSIVGILLGGFLSGAVVVEKVFDWPGLGALTVDSILSRDLFVVLGSVLVAAVLTVFANFLADVSLALNDPRIRYQ